jgi:hypothetical protein
MSITIPDDLRQRWTLHSAALRDSFRKLTGRALIAESGDAATDAQRLFEAPFVVVSHGAEADPILNYGNAAALALWEMTPHALMSTPSRLTAEPTLREARERLLAETARRGFVDGYEGVRISATGRRFLIRDVTIWNIADVGGLPLGQAATFADWRFLEKEGASAS